VRACLSCPSNNVCGCLPPSRYCWWMLKPLPHVLAVCACVPAPLHRSTANQRYFKHSNAGRSGSLCCACMTHSLLACLLRSIPAQAKCPLEGIAQSLHHPSLHHAPSFFPHCAPIPEILMYAPTLNNISSAHYSTAQSPFTTMPAEPVHPCCDLSGYVKHTHCTSEL